MSERGPNMAGSAFARELLFVRWKDQSILDDPPEDPYYGAAVAWVGQCPDGVDPRSEENPHTYTFEETFEDGWHREAPKNQWYIVGARREGRYWLGVDVDGDSSHAVTVDFGRDDLRVPAEGALLARSKSDWPHVYALLEEEPPALRNAVAGVDVMSDAETARQAGAISPWHDDRREVLNDPEVRDCSAHLEEGLSGGDRFISAEAEDGEVELLERRPEAKEVEVDMPDEAPDELSECAHRMLRVRSSEERYEYGDSPFQADTHAGMLLLYNGWSVEEATEWFARFPPAKDTGFDHDETEYQLRKLKEKIDAGDLHPPREKLMIPTDGCDCPLHGDGTTGPAGDEIGIGRVRSKVRSSSGQEKRDSLVLMRTMSNVAAEVGSSVEGSKVYHAPQGTRKTVHAAAGAADHPRLLIGGNKGEYRDTVYWAAEKHGVSVREIVPFSDHWLASSASPVREDVRALIAQDVEPRYIRQKFGHLVPDGHVDPFDEQFEEPITEDLLVGSPGHENVSAFRNIELAEGTVRRDVVIDDVDPAEELDENAFVLDEARAELNELIQFIPELESRSVTELLRSPDDVEKVERVAKGVPGEEDDELEFEAGDDVWGALDAATGDADDAIVVDIVEAVLHKEHVTGKSVKRLKAACGVEQRGVTTVTWTNDDGEEVISWVSTPNLSEHDVAVLGATHQPGVTEQWFRSIGHGEPDHVDLCPDWRAARRGQGYLVVQVSEYRNSRSGLRLGSQYYSPSDLQSKADRARAWTDAIEAAEGERPWIVDSYGMKNYYEKNDVLEDEDRIIHYGRERSNNEFMDKDVGFVAGPTYYGDRWIGLRAAYAGEHVEIEHPEGKGERAYCESELGQELMKFQIQAAMDQAIGRFGRDTDEVTRVYVDSDEIPGGWPTVDASEQVVEYNETEQEAHRAVGGGAETLEAVAEAVGVSRRQASNVVRSLERKGVVTVDEFALDHGRHRISGSSDICLSTYELPEISTGDPFVTPNAETRTWCSSEDGSMAQSGLAGDPAGRREGGGTPEKSPPDAPGAQAGLGMWSE